jgi:hypothetical protein
VPTIRRIDGPEATPVDLLALSRESVAKRAAPMAAAGAVLLAVFVLLRRRKR